jgi:hypothetical protein
MHRLILVGLFAFALLGAVFAAGPAPLEQEPNTWVKRSPIKGGPPSPGMGYEASMAYDPVSRRVLRWGGHNQGGGGEQNAELWTYDPAANRWTLVEPNTSPPGVCCAQQNVFDPVNGRFLRFAAFSGSHGWQWFREIYLNNSSVWAFDPATNTWRDRRPLPTLRTSPLRCAAFDVENQVAVIFGGEGNQEGTVVYDAYTNTWTRMKPTMQPAFRSGGNMAYDAAHKVHVLFGAQFSDDPHTWAYDLRKNEWRDLKPALQPPTDRNDSVLAYDVNGRVVLAVVRAADVLNKNEVEKGHLETWAFDAGKNTWTKLDPPKSPGGFFNRRRILVAVPDQNLILMENYVNPTDRLPDAEREQQVWTYRYAAARKDEAAPRPVDVRVTTTTDGATIAWKPGVGAGAGRYWVYRGEGATPWQVDMKMIPSGAPGAESAHDARLKPGTIYTYSVRFAPKDSLSSDFSVKVRTQPPLIEDGAVSVLSAKEVRVTWPASKAADVVGYHVERAVVEVFSEDQIQRLKKDTPPLAEPSVGALKAVGAFVRLTKTQIKDAVFTDVDLDLAKPQAVEGESLFKHSFRADQLDDKGKPYRFAVFAYRVRAVNALGVEGGPSPFWLTIPSAPQHLFSKEDSDQCQLKWKPNPEQKLKGYRVYRMEGPKVNGPGQPVTRLTVEPVAEPAFTDAKATKETKRYWVVAVDALGQEGFPSAPTWHYRQFRKYYEPFVGEWHQ